jgi:hypothetical protein
MLPIVFALATLTPKPPTLVSFSVPLNEPATWKQVLKACDSLAPIRFTDDVSMMEIHLRLAQRFKAPLLRKLRQLKKPHLYIAFQNHEVLVQSTPFPPETLNFCAPTNDADAWGAVSRACSATKAELYQPMEVYGDWDIVLPRRFKTQVLRHIKRVKHPHLYIQFHNRNVFVQSTPFPPSEVGICTLRNDLIAGDVVSRACSAVASQQFASLEIGGNSVIMLPNKFKTQVLKHIRRVKNPRLYINFDDDGDALVRTKGFPPEAGNYLLGQTPVRNTVDLDYPRLNKKP